MGLLIREVVLAPERVRLPESHLAVGTFGKVGQGLLDGRPVAIKEMVVQPGEQTFDFIREATMFHLLRHPNIVELKGTVSVSEENGAMLMTLAEGGSLAHATYGRKPSIYTFVQAARILRDAAKGLAFMHSKNCVHLDVKAANILLETAPGTSTPTRGVIADLGLAQWCDPNGYLLMGENSGTPGWMAPEAGSGVYCTKSDSFSLGVTMYEVGVGLPTSGDLRFPARVRALGPQACEFAAISEECTRPRPEDRPSCESLVGRLEEFIEKYRSVNQAYLQCRRWVVPANVRTPPRAQPR